MLLFILLLHWVQCIHRFWLSFPVNKRVFISSEVCCAIISREKTSHLLSKFFSHKLPWNNRWLKTIRKRKWKVNTFWLMNPRIPTMCLGFLWCVICCTTEGIVEKFIEPWEKLSRHHPQWTAVKPLRKKINRKPIEEPLNEQRAVWEVLRMSLWSLE